MSLLRFGFGVSSGVDCDNLGLVHLFRDCLFCGSLPFFAPHFGVSIVFDVH